LGTVLFVASSVGSRHLAPDKPSVASNRLVATTPSKPVEALDEKQLRRTQARTAFLSDVSIPLGTVRTAFSTIDEYAKTLATSTKSELSNAESTVVAHRKEEEGLNGQIADATSVVETLEASVDRIRDDLDALRAKQHPLSAYLVAYDAFVLAAGANRDASLEVQAAQAALSTENDRVSDAQDRLATVEQALKNAREDDDEGALRLAVDSARTDLEAASKVRDEAEDKWGAALDRLSRSVTAMDGASDELTVLRRSLDVDEPTTAELLKSVSMFEGELVGRAKASKSVELAQKELDDFSRRSNDAGRVYRDAEDQYYEALRRSGWFEANEYHRKLEARYRAGDGFDGIRKEDVQRAKESADRAYEGAETERKIMQDAKDNLSHERANEAKLKKSLATATRAYKAASDKVTAAAKELEKALAKARKSVGPEEEARLKQADVLSQRLTEEGKKLETAANSHTELVQKRERFVQARVKAQKIVDQLKKTLQADESVNVVAPITALIKGLDDARNGVAESLDLVGLEQLMSEAERAVADERATIRKLPKPYSDALRTTANALSKISRLVGQLKSESSD